MAEILVVDDEAAIRHALTILFEHHGHEVRAVATGEDGVRACRDSRHDVVFLDVSLPGIDGVEALGAMREHDSGVVAVFITAFGTIASAVQAIRSGGFDYLTKPFDNDDLLLTLDRAIEHRRLTQRVVRLEETLQARTVFPGVVGSAPALVEALRLLDRVSKTDTSVLILGESGTGKELAARNVHRRSGRADGPFVAINCAALPGTLAESSLFGHERGAFTDAHDRRAGCFEAAHRGTLFLDEIGELSLEVQAKMLRVLQEHEVQRLGASSAVPVDVRIVAATNREIEEDVARGRFREDLFWRLNQFSVRLPPLRDRVEDIPMLAAHLLDKLRGELDSPGEFMSARAIRQLQDHDWPGNVRELENVIRRSLILADTQRLDRVELPEMVDSPISINAGPEQASLPAERERLTEGLERDRLHRAMAKYRGRRQEVATELGISRRTLFNKLQKYGIGDESSDR